MMGWWGDEAHFRARYASTGAPGAALAEDQYLTLHPQLPPAASELGLARVHENSESRMQADTNSFCPGIETVLKMCSDQRRPFMIKGKKKHCDGTRLITAPMQTLFTGISNG
jgi:hypothetical protein